MRTRRSLLFSMRYQRFACETAESETRLMQCFVTRLRPWHVAQPCPCTYTMLPCVAYSQQISCSYITSVWFSVLRVTHQFNFLESGLGAPSHTSAHSTLPRPQSPHLAPALRLPPPPSAPAQPRASGPRSGSTSALAPPPPRSTCTSLRPPPPASALAPRPPRSVTPSLGSRPRFARRAPRSCISVGVSPPSDGAADPMPEVG